MSREFFSAIVTLFIVDARRYFPQGKNHETSWLIFLFHIFCPDEFPFLGSRLCLKIIFGSCSYDDRKNKLRRDFDFGLGEIEE